MHAQDVILHATCVSVAGKGILIMGPSGSGKSALAIQLIALGAILISDDRTVIARADDVLTASAPQAIRGMIEARGVGLLSVPSAPNVQLAAVIDMVQVETDRLPQRHMVRVLDISLPCLHKVDAPYFPAAVFLYARHIPNEL